MSSASFHTLHAKLYDRMANASTPTIARHILKSLNASTSTTPFPIHSSSRVLDLACGTGIVTKLVKESCPSTRVTALDLAPGMVSCMRELIKENHWEETVTAGEADIRDLSGVPSDSFSHAICNFGLASSVADLTGPARTVKEMWRVLDKGGVAVVSTWAERNWDAALEAVARKIRPHDEAYSWNIHADWTKGWFLMRLFEEAGFGYNVEVRNEPTYVEARDLDEMVENMMLFKDMFFKEYSEEEVAKIPALLKDELPKLKAFKQNEEGVKVEMMAWVGFASKE